MVIFSGWHRRLNGKVGRAALPMYVLQGLLQRETKLVTINMQLVSESTVLRNCRELFVNTDVAIH